MVAITLAVVEGILTITALAIIIIILLDLHEDLF